MPRKGAVRLHMPLFDNLVEDVAELRIVGTGPRDPGQPVIRVGVCLVERSITSVLWFNAYYALLWSRRALLPRATEES